MEGIAMRDERNYCEVRAGVCVKCWEPRVQAEYGIAECSGPLGAFPAQEKKYVHNGASYEPVIVYTPGLSAFELCAITAMGGLVAQNRLDEPVDIAEIAMDIADVMMRTISNRRTLQKIINDEMNK